MGELHIGKRKRKNKSHGKKFDNAFLSLGAWNKRLLIPLANEIYGQNIDLNAPIIHASNEYFMHDKLSKRITDATIEVAEGEFHFECESKKDAKIVPRVVEYDDLIALNGAKIDNFDIELNYPRTAVIFVRNHRNLPKEGTITYRMDVQDGIRKVKYFAVGNHSLSYLKEKKLYILFPFYLMRYEHAIKNNTEKKFKMIEKDAEKVYNYLREAYESKEITQKEYEDVLIVCRDVVKAISEGSKIEERLVDIMGDEILLTAEERGEKRGIESGLIALVNTLKDFCPNFETLYSKVVGNKIYANLTREDVKKYY